MSSGRNHVESIMRRVAAVCVLTAVFGCTPKSTPPGGGSIVSSGTGFNFTYLQWKEGLSLILVDDLRGGHGSRGSSSSGSPTYVASGYSGNDGHGYKWHLETSDGKSATFKIGDSNYDLNNGTLFVIKSKEGKIEVHQLKRDMSTIPYDADKCREALTNDAEVQKLLGRGGKE